VVWGRVRYNISDLPPDIFSIMLLIIRVLSAGYYLLEVVYCFI